jgi:hypothetical protein
MKNHMSFRIAVLAIMLAVQTSIPAVCLGDTQEYVFSGPDVMGRFIVENYSVSTPNPNDTVLQWTFSGMPYLFTATGGGLTAGTDDFQLAVRNNFTAFGRTDAYFLQAPSLELTLMGPTLALPVTSSLPHDLAAYSGLSSVRLWDGAAGGWMEFQVTTLTPVPEPAILSLVLAAAGCSMLIRRGISNKRK